ncbi:hypothetical protein AAMO2058_001081500 [Amorphochlora amoebiformis]
MPSNLRNLVRRRIHKERSQPAARAKYGLLEKKKDYKLRAINYHRKQDHIHKLRKKAAFRNPDEFYFGMNSTQTKHGIHTKRRKVINRTATEMKMANTQDLTYLTMKIQQESKKIEALKGSLHMLETDHSTRPNTHTIYVEDHSKLESFEAAKHFDTLPELVGQAHNRLTIKNLKENPLLLGEAAERTEKRKKLKRLRKYKELSERIKRKKDLGGLVHQVQTQRNLMGKGRRRKIVKVDEFGDEDKSKTTYKWKTQRKK